MKSDRLVIAAVLFLAAGLGLLFGFTNGATGLSLGYPFSATHLHVDITTTGIPALIGVPLIGAGALLLFLALISAIASQFRRPEPITTADQPAKRRPAIRRIRRLIQQERVLSRAPCGSEPKSKVVV